jgi:anti-sigma B factor antagonist
MAFGVEKFGDVIVAVVNLAQFDAGCADDFKQAITPVLNETRKLVLDLAAVEFIDSRGCGAILHCLKRLNEKGGGLRICQVRPMVRSVFELIRLHRICEILATRDEAIRAFPAAPSPGAAHP